MSNLVDLDAHRKLQEALRAAQVDEPELPLKGGDGGGTSSSMESRVTRLETHFEYVRRDLDDIRDSQGKILDIVGNLATKADLWAWKWQWTALAFAMVAIVIGGIIGGLSWIQPEPAPPTPVQVTITSPAPAIVPAKP
jgi:hypothetical protein